MKPCLEIGLLILMMSLSVYGQNIDGSLAKITETCGLKGASQHVWIFKQWHLSPGVDTRNNKGTPPQTENQRAIFKQLESWIENKRLETIFSEGCTGEITESFSKTFNGWTLKGLSEKVKDKDFDDIVTLIPLKLKAKYHDKIKALCADDEKIIQKQNESLSDARGSLGFLTRIEQLKDDPVRLKPFFEKVIELDHLPPHSSYQVVIDRLRKDLNDEIEKVKKGLDERNQVFLEAIKRGPKESALVVGGLHTAGLVPLLKKNNIDCTVVEPSGYRGDDERVLNTDERDRKSP